MPDAIRYYVVGLEGMIDEVGRLADPPTFKTIGSLETILGAAFADTQARTHVITGSLKNSGHTASDYDGEEWKGTITYGGPSHGFPNDPVVYAIYEMSRGGSHDFMAGLIDFEPLFEQVIDDHFSGRGA